MFLYIPHSNPPSPPKPWGKSTHEPSQVNCPLLQAVPENEELQRRCAALLEAIKELPVMGEQVGVMGWDGENFFPHFFGGYIGYFMAITHGICKTDIT